MGLFKEMNDFFVHKRTTKEISLIGRTSVVLSLLLNKEPLLMAFFDSPSPKKGSEIYRAIGNLRFHFQGHCIDPYLLEAFVIGSMSLLLSIAYLYLIEPELMIKKLYSQRLDNGLEKSKIRQEVANKRIQSEATTLTAIEPLYTSLEEGNKIELADLIIKILGDDRPGVRMYNSESVGIARAHNFLAAPEGAMMISQSDVTEEGRAFVRRFAQEKPVAKVAP
jgi:hypothetical protein